MRKSIISLPTLQPHATEFSTPSTTTSKLPSSYHSVRHHYPTRAILTPSPDDPLDTSILHFPLPPTKSNTNHQAQSSIASSTTLENQGIYALSQGHSNGGQQSRRRNLSLDSTLNEKYENAETISPPASIRSTSRLANSDSTRYNKSGPAQGSWEPERAYDEVDLERTGTTSGQKSGWEKEGRRGKKNVKLMWCFGIVLLVVVVVGVVVGVVYQRRKNSISRATQEILADDPRTTVGVPSTTAIPTTAISTARTSSRLPTPTTTTNSIALSIPSNIASIASSLAAIPTPPPSASSIAFAYVIAGVTTTITLPYSIPTNAEARGEGQVQWNSLVTIPDPANGGTVESLVRFRVPAPSAA